MVIKEKLYNGFYFVHNSTIDIATVVKSCLDPDLDIIHSQHMSLGHRSDIRMSVLSK